MVGEPQVFFGNFPLRSLGSSPPPRLRTAFRDARHRALTKSIGVSEHFAWQVLYMYVRGHGHAHTQINLRAAGHGGTHLRISRHTNAQASGHVNLQACLRDGRRWSGGRQRETEGDRETGEAERDKERQRGPAVTVPQRETVTERERVEAGKRGPCTNRHGSAYQRLNRPNRDLKMTQSWDRDNDSEKERFCMKITARGSVSRTPFRRWTSSWRSSDGEMVQPRLGLVARLQSL